MTVAHWARGVLALVCQLATCIAIGYWAGGALYRWQSSRQPNGWQLAGAVAFLLFIISGLSVLANRFFRWALL
jgi:hypothetical protein